VNLIGVVTEYTNKGDRMEIATRSANMVDVLSLTGRFDAYEATKFTELVEKFVTDRRNRLVVNFTEVSFIDSAALATLVKAMKRCREKQGDLILCCLQKPTKTIFELTRLDRAFKILDSEAKAIQAFTT